MANWDKLDDDNKHIREEPWSLYWCEMKTGTEEFEEYIHDPLTVLSRDLGEVDKSWTIQTNVLNHENGLAGSIVCNIAIADKAKNIVYSTLYKH